jgi:choline dehydrogenase-like flavoprotein
VVVKRNGAMEAYSSNIVVMSCGAINSAALLMHSANDKHPLALANSFHGHDCVDASFFPSSGAVNPALTIIANALRVGDHLRARLR